MRTIELFSGTKSFSKVMEQHNHQTTTVDKDCSLNPDVCADLRQIESVGSVDMLWASPPCTAFSVAAIGHHWGGGHRAYEPKTEDAKLGIELVEATLRIIEASQPTWFFIENPRGVLRKLGLLDHLTRHTVTYCQYGDTRMKPTDIWTNAYWWQPRPACKNGAPCHVAAPRGSKTGTQGIAGAKDRGVIPPAIFDEILSQFYRIQEVAA